MRFYTSRACALILGGKNNAQQCCPHLYQSFGELDSEVIQFDKMSDLTLESASSKSDVSSLGSDIIDLISKVDLNDEDGSQSEPDVTYDSSAQPDPDPDQVLDEAEKYELPCPLNATFDKFAQRELIVIKEEEEEQSKLESEPPESDDELCQPEKTPTLFEINNEVAEHVIESRSDSEPDDSDTVKPEPELDERDELHISARTLGSDHDDDNHDSPPKPIENVNVDRVDLTPEPNVNVCDNETTSPATIIKKVVLKVSPDVITSDSPSACVKTPARRKKKVVDTPVRRSARLRSKHIHHDELPDDVTQPVLFSTRNESE